MWEFGMYNEVTGERTIIYGHGYSFENAKKRYPSMDFTNWIVEYSEYVD